MFGEVVVRADEVDVVFHLVTFDPPPKNLKGRRGPACTRSRHRRKLWLEDLIEPRRAHRRLGRYYARLGHSKDKAYYIKDMFAPFVRVSPRKEKLCKRATSPSPQWGHDFTIYSVPFGEF